MSLVFKVEAQPLRIATYNIELERDGPGLLLRDILKRNDPQIAALTRMITALDADILVLQGVDYDAELVALAAFRDVISDAGLNYPHLFALPPNSGVQTGLDMDGNGRLNHAKDAQGYGEFFGQGGMAILSRYPFDQGQAQDFTTMLWQDLPGARLPETEDGPFPSVEARAVQRLSSVAHWVVPVILPDGPLHIMTFHATAPVFDGPEDMNGLRNHDELVFWQRYLDGTFGPAPSRRFVLLGGATIDPIDGEGLKEGITALLTDPRFQDPAPMRPAGLVEDSPGHLGDPRLDTVAWDPPVPGNMRASYVLPSADLRVKGAGVLWPSNGGLPDEIASRHRPVWVDILLE
jgi:hypothetical protein